MKTGLQFDASGRNRLQEEKGRAKEKLSLLVKRGNRVKEVHQKSLQMQKQMQEKQNPKDSILKENLIENPVHAETEAETAAYTRTAPLSERRKLKKKVIYEEHKKQTKARLKFEESFKEAAKPYGPASYGIPSSLAGKAAGEAGREIIRQETQEAREDNAAIQASSDLQDGASRLTRLSDAPSTAKDRLKDKRENASTQDPEPHGKEPRLRFTKEETETATAAKTADKAVAAKGRDKAAASASLKKRHSRDYAKAYRAEQNAREAAGEAASLIKSGARKAKDFISSIVKNNLPAIAVLATVLVILLIFLSSFGVLGSMTDNSGRAFVESTYLASDNAIWGADGDYCEKEEELQEKIDHIESDYPGYDEYRYQLDEITHDSFALTSYLTTLYGNYKKPDVQAELEYVFEEQYELVIEEEIEIRTRTETGTHTVTDEETGEETEEEYEYEVEYEWHVLNVTLVNYGLDYIAEQRLDPRRKMLYGVYMATLGNRPYLFDQGFIGNPAQGGPAYEIPPEALSDPAFAAMIQEAEKYLGTAYVWGGYDPSGFDCSGYVSYVLNHCGNGWDYGRLTANGLYHATTSVSPSNARPGDLIFFEKTYNTIGASHVGIYVGDGMMIHCGNPIQYTSIQSAYWQNHLLGYGRLP